MKAGSSDAHLTAPVNVLARTRLPCLVRTNWTSAIDARLGVSLEVVLKSALLSLTSLHWMGLLTGNTYQLPTIGGETKRYAVYRQLATRCSRGINVAQDSTPLLCATLLSSDNSLLLLDLHSKLLLALICVLRHELFVVRPARAHEILGREGSISRGMLASVRRVDYKRPVLVSGSTSATVRRPAWCLVSMVLLWRVSLRVLLMLFAPVDHVADRRYTRLDLFVFRHIALESVIPIDYTLADANVVVVGSVLDGV